MSGEKVKRRERPEEREGEEEEMVMRMKTKKEILGLEGVVDNWRSWEERDQWRRIQGERW